MQNKNDTLSENRSFTKPSPEDFYIGLTLALLSSFFIGSSFILKKKGLLKLTTLTTNKEPIGLRASNGGHGYLKEWLWWSGFLTMGVGEICNFVAYMFAPATLVTPLGAISVLISAVMAAYFLDEKLNTIGKIGCFLTAIGSTVMVIHAPKEGQIRTTDELISKILDIEFVSYCVLSIISLVFLIVIFAPRYGNQNILIYILICSILGSYTVMSCKGISLGIKEIITESRNLSYFYTFLFILTAVGCIVVQINYLNKSLDIYNTAIVTTVYYVLFTLFVMIASSLLFKELLNVSFQDFLGCMCGFGTIICALCLIHFFKTSVNNTNQFEFKSLNTLMNEKFNSNNTNNDLVTMIVHQDNQIINVKEPHINSNKLNENNELKFTKTFSGDKLDVHFNTNIVNVNSLSSINNIINTNTQQQQQIQQQQHQQQQITRSKEVINSLDEINSNDLSLINYLNLSFNKFKSKYFRRTPTDLSSSFQSYNYKKLITNDLIEDKNYSLTATEAQIKHFQHSNISNNRKIHNNLYKPLYNRDILSDYDDDDEDEIECSLNAPTDEINLIKK